MKYVAGKNEMNTKIEFAKIMSSAPVIRLPKPQTVGLNVFSTQPSPPFVNFQNCAKSEAASKPTPKVTYIKPKT